MADKKTTKSELLANTNTRMIGIVGAASFIVVFCLVASVSLYNQNRYQSKVAGAKQEANKQLDANISAYSSLQNSYKKFSNASTNAIGGNPKGTGDNDGNNAKIVLNSLPSVYDFPALTSSVEKILKDRNISYTNISGVDDQAAQSASSSGTPTAVKIPFSFTATANYSSVQDLLASMQKSIRPIAIDAITVSGSSSNLTATITAHTYFQPAKDLNITKKVVK